VDAEAEGFAQFVAARERALQRTARLLTGDWALAEDLVQTALGADQAARRPRDLRAPGPGEHLG
jgi:DNA-directed RNA polymerase specialized sigma24 family protein